MTAGTERERTWLVRDLPDLPPGTPITQGYLVVGTARSVRARRKGEQHVVTVKGGVGATRTEIEWPITPEAFAGLWPLTEGRRVAKVRHEVPVEGGTAEVDVFEGALEGLVIVEVEFDTDVAMAAFDPPDWFGAEVTDHGGYTNASLACAGLPDDHRACCSNRADPHPAGSAASGTTSTGQAANSSTCAVTLPRYGEDGPCRSLRPITTRSAGQASASWRICRNGSPSRSTISQAAPRSAAISATQRSNDRFSDLARPTPAGPAGVTVTARSPPAWVTARSAATRAASRPAGESSTATRMRSNRMSGLHLVTPIALADGPEQAGDLLALGLVQTQVGLGELGLQPRQPAISDRA